MTSIACTKYTVYTPVLMQLLITGAALKKVAYSMLKGGDIKLLDVIIEVNKQSAVSLPAPFGDVVKQMGSSSLVVDQLIAMNLPQAILDECESVRTLAKVFKIHFTCSFIVVEEVEDSSGTHVILLAGNSPSLSEQGFGLQTTATKQVSFHLTLIEL